MAATAALPARNAAALAAANETGPVTRNALSPRDSCVAGTVLPLFDAILSA